MAVAAASDVLVIGAGIVGCAAAYELARRGASVRVLDDRAVGLGATQASAGMLVPYIESSDEDPLLELAERSLNLFDRFVERVSEASGARIPYRRTGTLDVAFDEETLGRFRRSAEWLARRGLAAELLDAAGARRAEPLLDGAVLGGLLVASHGYVAAGELASALAAAARRHGAEFITGGRVRRISGQSRDVAVETGHESFRGGGAVLAAGCWSGLLEVAGAAGIAAPVPVRPVRGQLLRLAWKGAPLKRVTWGGRCYLVPWEDGTVLVGATAEEAGFDERTTAAGVRDLIEAACEVVPSAWTAGFVSARAGLRPATPDELPIIGRSKVVPNLMYATGHYRNGVLLAPLTADLVADAMLADRVDPLMVRTGPERFGAL